MSIDRILPLLVLTSLCWLGCRAKPTDPPPEGTLIMIPGDAPTNDSSCDDRLAFALDKIDDLSSAANGNCNSDSDCTLVFAETQCQGACPVAILRDRLDAFRDGQNQINGRACKNYAADGCPYATPTCMAVEAVCNNGRCGTDER